MNGLKNIIDTPIFREKSSDKENPAHNILTGNNFLKKTYV